MSVNKNESDKKAVTKMQFLDVDKSDIYPPIERMRRLVDEYNSYGNRELTDVFFDEILIQYSEIQLHQYKFRNDPEVWLELEENPSRYTIKKYSFFHKSGDK
mgnify:CR=1 FL=1